MTCDIASLQKDYSRGCHESLEAIGVYLCVKKVRIRSFSGSYFPAFGLNTERYGVSLRIQSECRKMRTKKPEHFSRSAYQARSEEHI